MMNSWRGRIDCETPNPLNGSQGMTRGGNIARAKKRKKLRELAWIHVRAAILAARLELPAKVRLTRISQGTLDAWDGLPASLKPIVDGIADAFGIRDDDPDICWMPPAQRKEGRGVKGVEIEIEKRIS